MGTLKRPGNPPLRAAGKTFGIGIIVSLAVASFVAAWQHRYAKENGWLINSTDLSDSDADEPLD